MTAFRSRWLEWEGCQTASCPTPKTPKSPFAGFAGATGERLERNLEGAQLDGVTDEVEGVWDFDTRELIDWFLTATPPAEPFELCQGVTILDPTRWWRAIRGEIECGPAGPRARYGAIQNDLRNLAARFRVT